MNCIRAFLGNEGFQTDGALWNLHATGQADQQALAQGDGGTIDASDRRDGIGDRTAELLHASEGALGGAVGFGMADRITPGGVVLPPLDLPAAIPASFARSSSTGDGQRLVANM